MTLEQLCNSSADELEKLSQKELEEFFAPYLNVTRPERAKEHRQSSQKVEAKMQAIFVSPTKVAALNALKDAGVDLSFLKSKKRKF